jgi:hypothetical protein
VGTSAVIIHGAQWFRRDVPGEPSEKVLRHVAVRVAAFGLTTLALAGHDGAHGIEFLPGDDGGVVIRKWVPGQQGVFTDDGTVLQSVRDPRQRFAVQRVFQLAGDIFHTDAQCGQPVDLAHNCDPFWYDHDFARIDDPIANILAGHDLQPDWNVATNDTALSRFVFKFLKFPQKTSR